MVLASAMLIASPALIPALAGDEPSASATTTSDERRAATSILAEIDLPGTDDAELVAIADAVLDDHGAVIPVRRLPCSTWEAYKAALEGKVTSDPSAFAYWLLATVSEQCAGST